MAEPLTNKPLRHLDALYPGVSFMLITDMRDKSKSIVGTRQTVRGKAVYCERPLDREEVELAAEINKELANKADKDAWLSDGSLITAFEPTLAEGELNRAQRRAK